MKALFFLLSISLLDFAYDRSRFGYEHMQAFYNKEKVGQWMLNKMEIEKLILNYTNCQDTLFLAGFCDSGCLDGTILKITDNNQLIATVTRRSPILHGDSIMINNSSKEKQTFQMDNGVTFKIFENTFNKLSKNKVYKISLRRIIDKSSKDIHIFDLELK